MNNGNMADQATYKVVVNCEQQYSIWPADKENALGWTDEGVSGSKEECLAHIDEVWTDMRPLSLRERMAEDGAASGTRGAEAQGEREQGERESLVARLGKGKNPVEAVVHPDKAAGALKESIERGYVHIKFTNTRGGTELGVQVDSDHSDFADADFEAGTGEVHIEGTLTLDYQEVRCIADIDVGTLVGAGWLRPAATA